MRLGTENVDHIEVVQGAASAKYGADAIGGVINVVTKKQRKHLLCSLMPKDVEARVTAILCRTKMCFFVPIPVT